MNKKGLQINDTVRCYPRTLMEAFPCHEPYAIEHYKRKINPWPWIVAAACGWAFLCYHLV